MEGNAGEKYVSYEARLDLDFDGTGRLFCGRIANTTQQGQLVFFDTILAGNVASFFAAMGAVYEAAGYVGHVDVGVATIGLQGSVPFGQHHWGDEPGFLGPAPGRTARVSAAQLRDEPKAVALMLIGRLLEALTGRTYSPFDDAET
jgi:hypothetical protein